MRIRWRGLELPTGVRRDDSVSVETYGRFLVEPFERGFGTTVGNSLRRILLSSLEGAAVTHCRLAGADHEFCALPGVLEDVTDIILNVKSIVVKCDADSPKKMRVERKKRGEIRAADFERDPSLSIQSPDQLVATLTDDVAFSCELTVSRGRGYASAADNEVEDQELGIIAVDSIFSPVTRVRYRTEDTRVGHKTNYDRLILEIWTKGTVRPEDALVEAAKILRKHLNPFVLYHEIGHQLAAVEPKTAAAPPVDDELNRKLGMPISQLELSVRSNNCLEAAKIITVGELVSMNETDLMQIRSFGKTSLDEVNRKLSELGLALAMNVDADNAATTSEHEPASAPAALNPQGVPCATQSPVEN